MTSLVKIQFLTDFELLFGRVFFLDFWKMLYQYFILNTPETFFGMYRVRKLNLQELIPLPHPVYTKKLLRLGKNVAF